MKIYIYKQESHTQSLICLPLGLIYSLLFLQFHSISAPPTSVFFVHFKNQSWTRLAHYPSPGDTQAPALPPGQCLCLLSSSSSPVPSPLQGKKGWLTPRCLRSHGRAEKHHAHSTTDRAAHPRDAERDSVPCCSHSHAESINFPHPGQTQGSWRISTLLPDLVLSLRSTVD